MDGSVFTYIVDLANELLNKYDIYVAYAIRNQTPKNYRDYFNNRIHPIEIKNFEHSIKPTKDIKALFEIKSILKRIKPDVIRLHTSRVWALGRMVFNSKEYTLIVFSCRTTAQLRR